VSLLLSRCGRVVLKEECGIDWNGDEETITGRVRSHFAVHDRLEYYADDNFFAPLASGSSAPDTLVICPCSLGTVGRIAAGLSGTLIERTADVMLKEGRPLLLVPREMPLSALHLENLLKLARLGVRIVPPMPAFYQQPQSLADLVDFVVGKILDQLGAEHGLFTRWGAR
jgi:4-hydroxy-3-polyprenylbenzoate decarboxylase